MRKVNVSITYELTTTHVVEKEIDVPQSVLDGDEFFDWVSRNGQYWEDGEGDVQDEDTQLTEADWDEIA